MGSVIPSAMTASYIGRQLGPIYLDGFTLASLTGNLLTLSLLTGLFSASETLSPQAFGAGNYKEVGLLAIRGFVGSFFLMIPINIVLIPYMQDILVWAGQDEVTSGLAARWYRIYVYSIPFHALYDVTWTFLSSQEVMTPLLVVMVGTCGVILPTALTILVKCMGFLGSAVALVVYQASQAGLLIVYLVYYQPHHPLTWPGLHLWREALAFQPIMNYMRLGVGGMLANSVCVYVHEYAGPLSLSFIHMYLSLLSLLSSLSLSLSLSLKEWWYWEVLSLFVGTLGVLPLSVHVIPTQVLTVCFMIPLGIGIALSIRLGATLPRNVKRAQQLVLGCTLVSTALFTIMAILMFMGRNFIFRLFTTEPNVLDGCERIWWKVVVYFFVLAVFGINMGIATGLGMQWTLGIVTLIFLWIVGLPAIYYFALLRGGGLETAWTLIYPPYIFINAVLVVAFCLADWHAIGAAIRKREGMSDQFLHERDIETSVSDDGPKFGPIISERRRLLSFEVEVRTMEISH
jgi:MATE family multidrug resistance protein